MCHINLIMHQFEMRSEWRSSKFLHWDPSHIVSFMVWLCHFSMPMCLIRTKNSIPLSTEWDIDVYSVAATAAAVDSNAMRVIMKQIAPLSAFLTMFIKEHIKWYWCWSRCLLEYFWINIVKNSIYILFQFLWFVMPFFRHASFSFSCAFLKDTIFTYIPNQMCSRYFCKFFFPATAAGAATEGFFV